jgi:hypothetical protein
VEIKQLAIDKLANTMRIYVETKIDFERLKNIDLEEAINNLDRAFEAKLEAFHSLYDVTKTDFEYFDYADSATLIMLRNAIHHRDHFLFKSWNYEMLLNDGLKKNHGAEFLLASHNVMDDIPKMKYYYKLDDFYARIDSNLDSPYLETKMSKSNREKLVFQLKNELHFDMVSNYAKSNRYPTSQIYINVIPIFISAVSKVFKALKSKGTEFKGFDSKVYEEPFVNELEVNMKNFSYMPIRVYKS